MKIFWFKRDLRLEDNEALFLACASQEPLLLIYILEPSLERDYHTSKRHLNFIKESLTDLNQKLNTFGTRILMINDEALNVFKILSKHIQISEVYSTQEIGIEITYKRDIEIAKWFNKAGIKWSETQYNGVIRGLKNRNSWSSAWNTYMNTAIQTPDLQHANFYEARRVTELQQEFEIIKCDIESHQFQIGGRSQAILWADSFFNERILGYTLGISKPELSRHTCSRLSPYFAWGNLSVREIYQRAIKYKSTSKDKRPVNAFLARLRWQSHFIQKFEMEPRMEFEAVNRAYLDLKQPTNDNFIHAWKTGLTGYPLVDASVRALEETGYLNFRMRTMITSFYCHHLFQHFSEAGLWLARQFLDFEPGIHYGQLQMQAGFTGTNTIRIYNPTKNAIEHDSDARFIKTWVKELSGLPTNLAIEPWTMTPMEEELYGFQLGRDYPKRIVDIAMTRKIALRRLYGIRKSEYFHHERKRILEKHTIKRN